ncbi:MAG: hypothetical protein WKG07_38410 [Hymenobacter sp.]
MRPATRRCAACTTPFHGALFAGQNWLRHPPNTCTATAALHPRATAVGIRNTLRTLKGAGHVPFENNAAYADTTFWTIRDFLRPILRLPGTYWRRGVATSLAPGSSLPYPRPRRYVQLALPENWRYLGSAWPLDMTGRVVRRLTPSPRRNGAQHPRSRQAFTR